MGVLSKIMDKAGKDEDDDDVDGSDVHHVQCAGCSVKPIRHLDRYRCLECSSSLSGSYDLCGRCFDQRRQTSDHHTGHAMIHFKLPNEFLGIDVNQIGEPINLNTLRRVSTLQNEQHLGVTCDGHCHQKSIRGLRFKCDTCPSYNLCHTCAIDKRLLSKDHQRDHPLIVTSNKVIPKIDPTDIELGEELGKGAFGSVCKARWRSKNRQVACKIIEVSGTSKESIDLQRSFLQELAAYREVSGPYILRTFAYSKQSHPRRVNTDQLMIIMELMERGSLQNLLDNEPHQLSLRRKLVMARQIASAMRRIHQHGMIHRDIRPDNILVNSNSIAKIGDMGIARVLDRSHEQTQIGCLPFMPPEFFTSSADDGHIHYDETLDIYTYGLTLNQLFTETKHHFRLSSPADSRMTLTKTSPVFYDEIISACLDNDPKRRPTAAQIHQRLEFYEKTFGETMITDSYVKMSIEGKDRVFMEFYQKNRSRIEHFLRGHPSAQASLGNARRSQPRRDRRFSRLTPANQSPEEPCRTS